MSSWRPPAASGCACSARWAGWGQHRVSPASVWRWLGHLQLQHTWESGETSRHGVPPTVPPHLGSLFPSFFFFLSHQRMSLPAAMMSLLPPAAPPASGPLGEQVSSHYLMGAAGLHRGKAAWSALLPACVRAPGLERPLEQPLPWQRRWGMDAPQPAAAAAGGERSCPSMVLWPLLPPPLQRPQCGNVAACAVLAGPAAAAATRRFIAVVPVRQQHPSSLGEGAPPAFHLDPAACASGSLAHRSLGLEHHQCSPASLATHAAATHTRCHCNSARPHTCALPLQPTPPQPLQLCRRRRRSSARPAWRSS